MGLMYISALITALATKLKAPVTAYSPIFLTPLDMWVRYGVGLMFGRHDISMPRLPDTSRTVYIPNTDPLLLERAVTTDRDARRSDGSNKYEGVRQQCITERH